MRRRYQKPQHTDFQFLPAGFGRYKVTYYSPVTNKSWSRYITDMSLVDDIKGNDSARVSRMYDLIRTIKS